MLDKGIIGVQRQLAKMRMMAGRRQSGWDMKLTLRCLAEWDSRFGNLVEGNWWGVGIVWGAAEYIAKEREEVWRSATWRKTFALWALR